MRDRNIGWFLKFCSRSRQILQLPRDQLPISASLHQSRDPPKASYSTNDDLGRALPLFEGEGIHLGWLVTPNKPNRAIADKRKPGATLPARRAKSERSTAGTTEPSSCPARRFVVMVGDGKTARVA